MSTLALIGLGSNLGDRKAHLDAAIAALCSEPAVEVRGVSSYHETRPVGGPAGQPPFLNAAAALETALDPLDVLHVLQRIEAQEGRERSVRWGVRTLDLDLLLHGDQVIDTGLRPSRKAPGRFTELRVPHPRMAVRRFVLAPLSEIAPEAVHPLTGRTVASLLANLDRRPSYVALHDPRDPFGARSEPGASFTVNALSQLLASRLGATLLCPPSMPPFLLDPVASDPDQNRHLQALREWCRSLEERLRVDQPQFRALREGWVVSTGWFDGLAALAARILPPRQWPEFQDEFRAARGSVLAPTFVLALRARAEELAWGHFPTDVCWFPPLGDVPVVELEPTRPSGSGEPEFDEPTALEQVVAACAGTRPG